MSRFLDWLADWLDSLRGPVPVGGPRSSRWQDVRDEFLEDAECLACGTREKLEAHHVRPFHEHPELELERSNLVALCRTHHLVFGHLGCFRCANPFVVEDATAYRDRVKANRGDHHVRKA
jgi:5-methylcytosine-specific restriction protein A